MPVGAVLLISRDLFLTSRITGAAGRLGLPLKIEPNAATALRRLGEEAFAAVLVDLTHPDAAPADIAAALPADSASPRPRLVAYGPHVHKDRLTEAREAGFDEVLTRGQFDAQMPEVLARCADS
jgi:CheY-like chemotaxis protein